MQEIERVEHVDKDAAFPSVSCAAEGTRGSQPLGELHVVVPAVGGPLEAIALGDNVEEHEEALLYADLAGDVGFGVLEQPVGQLHEGDLVHVAELVEAVGHAVEQKARSLRACGAHDGHVEMRAVAPMSAVATAGVADDLVSVGMGCSDTKPIQRARPQKKVSKSRQPVPVMEEMQRRQTKERERADAATHWQLKKRKREMRRGGAGRLGVAQARCHRSLRHVKAHWAQ
jgi:hypothetical protein